MITRQGEPLIHLHCQFEDANQGERLRSIKPNKDAKPPIIIIVIIYKKSQLRILEQEITQKFTILHPKHKS